MRTAFVGFLILAASVAGMATAADGLTGSWRSHPVPEQGNLVIEFFADGTGLFTHEKNADMSGPFRVRETKQPGLFELVAPREEYIWATFEVKAPGVAVLTDHLLKTCRMIPGGFDD